MIREKLMEINQETWNSDKIDLQEQFVREFAIGFGEYLDTLTTEDMGTLSIKELLKIYENGDRR